MAPRVSVIVPSWRGETAALRAGLAAQSYQDHELIVVVGVAPAGRARNKGVARARGELIVFIDDDATLGHPQVLERLVAALERDPTLGVAGAAKLLSPGASALQRRIAGEVPRWVCPPADEDRESNPPLDRHGFSDVTTTCCALRREVFEAAAGFDPELETGEDPELFYRLRRAGYRLVIVGATWVHHDPPARVGELLRKSFRYGIGHAQQARKHPSRRMELVPLGRWRGRLLVLLSPLLALPLIVFSPPVEPGRRWRLGFRPLRAASALATLYGYAAGWARAGRAEPPAESVATASRSSAVSGAAFFVIALINNLFAIVMAALLPVAEYGVLGLAQSWLLIAATLLNSGFSWELARVVAQGAPAAQVRRTAKGALLGVLALAAVCCLALGAAAGLGMFAIGAGVVGLLAAETLLLAVAAVLAGLLQGSLRFATLSGGRVLEAAVKALAGVALVLAGGRAFGALLATLLGTLVSLLPLAWGARRQLGFWREPGWGEPRSYRHALLLLAGLGALTVIGNLDVIGLSLFSPPGQAATLTGYYQSAAVLARIPTLLAGVYGAALFPYFVRSTGRELQLYTTAAMKYTLLLIAPLCLIFATVPEAIIGLIFPAAFTTAAGALRLSALGALALAVATVLAALLQARGAARYVALWLAGAALLELAALGLLAPLYGVMGAGMGLLVGALAGCAGLAVRARPLLASAGRGAGAGYLAASAALVALLAALPSDGPLALALALAVALGAYCLILALSGVLRPSDLATLSGGDAGRWPAALRRLYGWLRRLVEQLNRLGDGLAAGRIWGAKG